MGVKFLFIYNFIKKFVSSILLVSIALYGCSTVDKENRMDSSFDNDSIETKDVGKSNKKNEKSRACGSILCGVIGAIVGAGIATAIEVPVYNNRLDTQSNQDSTSFNDLNYKSALLVNAIIPALAENENAIYGLANGTNITGNDGNITNLNYGDILGISSVEVVSNTTLYTAEEEFAFKNLVQILPSLRQMKNFTANHQYISYPINLTDTSLSFIDLSGTYFSNQLILPATINTVVLNSSVLCTNGSIVCTGGNSTNSNCNNDTISNSLNSFNQGDFNLLGSMCETYTDYQQILTNYTSLLQAYDNLENYIQEGGSQGFLYYYDHYNNCSNQNTFPNAYDLYKKCNVTLNDVTIANDTCNTQLSTCVGNNNTCNRNLNSCTGNFNYMLNIVAVSCAGINGVSTLQPVKYCCDAGQGCKQTICDASPGRCPA